MSISLACSECDKKLKVADTAAGKKIRCPVCKAIVAVPEAEDFVEPDEDEDTAVSEKPTKKPSKSTSKSHRPPSRKRRDEDDDDFEDEEEEEEERRPKKKKKKKRRQFDDRRGGDVPHRGITILIMGLASILFGCFPIAAWYLGYRAMSMANEDLDDMERGRVDRSGKGLVLTGKVCGIIGCVLGVIWIVIAVGLRLAS
jgi:phage FluMu protein Com